MTMRINEELLARVMKSSGATSKTHAIDLALREMDRKATLLKLCSEGLGLAPEELKDAVDPKYDLKKMRQREMPTHYGRKPRSR